MECSREDYGKVEEKLERLDNSVKRETRWTIACSLVIPVVFVAAAYGVFRMGNYHLDIMESVGNIELEHTR